jgi:hypothetical protein
MAWIAMLAATTLAGAAMAADPAPASATPSPVVKGQYSTKQLLLLMDQDRNGKVSKDEFMAFMSAEFDSLDVNKDGSLDVAELTGVRIPRSHPTNHK